MDRILNFKDLYAFIIEKDIWDFPYHNHNCYELILIDDGKGKHRLNDVTFEYKKGDVFLLNPSDMHEFEIEKKTRFLFIKFTESYVTNILTNIRRPDVKQSIDLLLKNHIINRKTSIESERDTAYFFKIIKIIFGSYLNRSSFNDEFIAQLFLSALILLARNFALNSDDKNVYTAQDEKIDKIISYINLYATDNQKMKIENLAKEFLMSENYISIYVKKHTGLSIQNYIMQFKLISAEFLLKHSQLNINEIAEKLGFNDASHFNKMFKKYKNISPLAFRVG